MSDYRPIDMSQFEAQFGEYQYSDEMPDSDFVRLADIKQEIADITELQPFRKEEWSWLRFKQAGIQAVIKRLEAMLVKQRAKRKVFDDALIANERIARNDENRLEALQREYARLLAELASRRRYFDQKNEILGLSEQFPWSTGVDNKRALPHQIDGAYRLFSAQRAILGDKPGLGKTLEIIMTIDLLRTVGQGQKVLIFTPKSVLKDFERAFQFWTNPTFVHVLNQSTRGSKDAILEAMAHFPQAIVLTNYEIWHRNPQLLDALKAVGFDTVFFDEAHNLKNAKAKVTSGAREIIYAENRCPKCGQGNIGNRYGGSFCLTCEYTPSKFDEFCSVKNVYHATGTPILNEPKDLWALLNMIDREAFPSEKAFLEDYCVKLYNYDREQYYWSFGPGGSERLLKKLGMRYTARTRESAGVKMPPQEVVHHWLELDEEKYPRHAAFVRELRDRARIAFSEDEQMTQDQTLAWYMYMRMAASWPDSIEIKGCAHEPKCYWVDPETNEEKIKCENRTVIFPKPGTPPVGESVMMDEAEEIVLNAVESGDRIIVFSMYKKVMAELERRCLEKGIRVGVLHGGVSNTKRQVLIDDFNANTTKVGEHQFDVLICQSRTGAVGLSLHGAQQLLVIEREWSPGLERQMFDRVRRLDSQYETIVHVLHCEGTATALIDAILAQKEQVVDGHEAVVDYREAMRKYLEG